MRGGRYHNFTSKLFCLTVPNHFLEEPLCLRKFRVSKNFMHMRKGGVLRFSIRKTLSHTTENLRRGRLVFLVTKKVEDKRERGASRFSSIFLRLSTEGHRVPFGVSENFWYRKILWMRGAGRREFSLFSVENLLSRKIS